MSDSSTPKSNRFKGLMQVIRQPQASQELPESEQAVLATDPETLAANPQKPEIIWVPHARIKRDAEQSRRYFDPTELNNMAASMKAVGILDPLSVRPRPNSDGYDLLAGEKRHRSAEIAGLDQIPVRVFDVDDSTAEDIKAISNLQRGDLNKWEETNAIMGMLCRNLGKSQEEVCSLLNQAANQQRGLTPNVVRKEEWHVVEEVFTLVGRLTPESFRKHRVPLLKLPAAIQSVLQQGKLSYTKVNEVLKVKDPEQQSELLEVAIAQNLSVDQIQSRVKELRQTTAVAISSPQKPTDIPKRLAELTQQAKNSTTWQDVNKQNRLTKLLNELEKLLSD